MPGQAAVNLIQEAGTAPAAVGTVAGLPRRAAIQGARGEVVPGGVETQFAEDAIQGGTRAGGRAATSEGGGGRDEGLDESPLFVSQVHGEGWNDDMGTFAALRVYLIFGLKNIGIDGGGGPRSMPPGAGSRSMPPGAGSPGRYLPGW